MLTEVNKKTLGNWQEYTNWQEHVQKTREACVMSGQNCSCRTPTQVVNPRARHVPVSKVRQVRHVRELGSKVNGLLDANDLLL